LVTPSISIFFDVAMAAYFASSRPTPLSAIFAIIRGRMPRAWSSCDDT
jgi:hypothetical protein